MSFYVLTFLILFNILKMLNRIEAKFNTLIYVFKQLHLSVLFLNYIFSYLCLITYLCFNIIIAFI